MVSTIYITGAIGTFTENGELTKGVELIDVISQVKKFPEATTIKVLLNTEGGLVDIGDSIYNYLVSLKASGKRIHMIGTGIVASIGVKIFMAGDDRQITPGTQFMIHQPYLELSGDADTLKKAADYLEKHEKEQMAFYTKALQIEEEGLRPLFNKESWLTPEQLTSLGFTNMPSFQVTAKAVLNIKKDNMSNLSDKDKSWFETQFENILAKFKGTAKNKLVQDATGKEIDFPDVADSDAVEKGATATVDGQPANGEYLLPSGETYVFEAGKLIEIKPAEEEKQDSEEVVQLKQKNTELEKELSDVKAEFETLQKTHGEVKKDVEDLKKAIKSKYTPDDKKPEPTPGEGGSTYNDALNRAKNLRK